MTRPTSGAGPGNDSGPVVTRATTNAQNLDTSTIADTTVEAAAPPLRMKCRTAGCSGDRPVVMLGCARGWDRCARCAGRMVWHAAHPIPDDRPDVDYWAERVWELLDAVEMVGVSA